VDICIFWEMRVRSAASKKNIKEGIVEIGEKLTFHCVVK
jgi:hypothetical protein